MSELANNRRELFARARAKGMTLVASQKQAGYKPNTGSASALAKVPEVSNRIAELKEIEKQSRFIREQERRKILHDEGDPNEITLRWVQAELYENLRLAREAGKFNAANKALEMLAQSLDLFDTLYQGSITELMDQDVPGVGQIDTDRMFEVFKVTDCVD